MENDSINNEVEFVNNKIGYDLNKTRVKIENSSIKQSNLQKSSFYVIMYLCMILA